MASSSSSPSATPFSSSSKSWKYDVFLSFRGEDTRKTFVDHLYSALEQHGIYTYKDDVTLPRGESISPSLLKAIGESQIAIIVFSKNYANSTWCLDELTHIIKCRNERGQTVMPIFYDVDPSEVRKQKRKYKEAFDTHELEKKNRIISWRQAVMNDPLGWLSAPREQNRKYREAAAKHELENKTKVESWRKALVEASNISGWETTQIANGHESQGIKQIVVEILERLNLVTPKADENLIGMDARVQDLKSELQVESGGVLMIGIWGVGGGGKTTLASSVYREISNKFNGCCFIKDIRGESSKYGLEKLQQKIISEMEVAKAGGRLIDIRFRRRKVLIVLDDVDHLDQLKALAGSHNWFGEGSRIIITTRDVHLLNAHRVDVMHKIRLLNDAEAMNLFHKLALQDYRPKEDYERLSKQVVSYAGGLPLALTVLGSFLCDKDIDEWMSALDRLKEIPNDDIVGKLKISFDGLTKVEKDLFLDIACFFRGEQKKWAMEILDACGFHPVVGVKVLIQKALITISEGGEFGMHDLVQEMGHHIVRGEHPNNPEKHSRVWKKEDVLKICAMGATTELDMIEAIQVNYFFNNQPGDNLSLVANTKNLRWINWKGDFASNLLSNFPQMKLCCLILTGSLQKQLWEGYKLLPNLKTIELYGLDNLIMTPDFNGLPNLQRFVLGGCLYLEEMDPSIGRLKSLVYLLIGGCPRLEKFPPITKPKKLKTLEFPRCPKLFNTLEIQKQNMDTLGKLDLDNSGKEVVSYIEYCLEEPCLPDNNMKPCLRDNNMNHIGLQFFFEDLRKLDLSFCSLGDEDIISALWDLPNLQELNLRGNDFSRLSFRRLQLPRLKLLNVSYCEGLVELSELPSSVAVVLADCCTSLETCGDISNCKWLWHVSLLFGNNRGGDILLDSMLQGNAIEDRFIIVILENQIPKGFVGRLFRRNTFTLHFTDNWYSDFWGFLICVVTQDISPEIAIVIKQEVDEDSLFALESNEAEELESDGMRTFIGYVSFGSLRHTTFSNSSYTMISVSTNRESYVIAELAPRKSKAHQVQTTKVATDFSEFYEQELNYGQPSFTIQDDSISSIKIVVNVFENTPQESEQIIIILV